jgi:hypothetical protein
MKVPRALILTSTLLTAFALSCDSPPASVSALEQDSPLFKPEDRCNKPDPPPSCEPGGGDGGAQIEVHGQLQMSSTTTGAVDPDPTDPADFNVSRDNSRELDLSGGSNLSVDFEAKVNFLPDPLGDDTCICWDKDTEQRGDLGDGNCDLLVKRLTLDADWVRVIVDRGGKSGTNKGGELRMRMGPGGERNSFTLLEEAHFTKINEPVEPLPQGFADALIVDELNPMPDGDRTVSYSGGIFHSRVDGTHLYCRNDYVIDVILDFN